MTPSGDPAPYRPEEPGRIHPWFVFLLIGLTGLITWGIMRHQQAQALVQIQETMEARFKSLGNAAQAQGHVVSQNEIQQIVQQSLGKAVASQGRQVAVVTATASLPAMETQERPAPILISSPSWAGAVEQDRGGKPSLTAVLLRFDPSTGLSTVWQNHAETFRLGFAEWRTSGDGLRAAARLSREVGGKIEEIPLTSADAFFPASEVVRRAPLPAHGLAVGLGYDPRGRVALNVLYERPIDRNHSFFGGYANGGALAMYKFTWGTK